ncbi:hypothetical protein H1R20_g2956, partial [Candolleomyces eurysporus]
MAAIIVDDSKLLAGSNLVGAQWESQTTAPNAFNGTISLCRTGTGGAGAAPPSLSYSFDGTGFSLYGRPTEDLSLTYSIDGSSPAPVTLHTEDSIDIIENARALYLDFITYVPYNISSHVGEDVVVDDQDSTIAYTGTWRPSFGSSTPVGDPYNGTWSQTRTAGSSFKADFTGSSVSVYGSLRPMSGRLTATYAVDNGTPQSIVHYDGTQTTTPEGSVSWGMNRVFYKGDLTPGPHTITVTVSEVTETQEYFFDYITYKASPQAWVAPTDTPNTPGSTSTSRKMSKGAKAGAIVGSIVGFLLLLLLLLWFLKRRRDRRNDGDAEKGAAAAESEKEEDDKDKASGSLPPWSPPHLGAGASATPSDGQSLLKEGSVIEKSATPPPANNAEPTEGTAPAKADTPSEGAAPAKPDTPSDGTASAKPDTPSDGQPLSKEGSDTEQEKPESATPAPAST